MEVITSKGVEQVNSGYWVAYNEESERYEVIGVNELDNNIHSWSEGIFGTIEEAEARRDYQERMSK